MSQEMQEYTENIVGLTVKGIFMKSSNSRNY